MSESDPGEERDESGFDEAGPKRLTYQETAAEARQAWLTGALDDLDPRIKTIFELRFGLTGEKPMTFFDIARAIRQTTPEQLSPERVEYILNKTLLKLRVRASRRTSGEVTGDIE